MVTINEITQVCYPAKISQLVHLVVTVVSLREGNWNRNINDDEIINKPEWKNTCGTIMMILQLSKSNWLVENH